jgi:hypothetical protein
MNKLIPKFNLDDNVYILENADFIEKTEKNRLVYNTYKNKVAIIKDIKSQTNNITYILEMRSKSGTLFTFDILEKYIEKCDQADFLVNDKVKLKDNAEFLEKNEENRKSYETYKKREGTIVEIHNLHPNKENTTYIVEILQNQKNTNFKFDILGKYLEKIN